MVSEPCNSLFILASCIFFYFCFEKRGIGLYQLIDSKCRDLWDLWYIELKSGQKTLLKYFIMLQNIQFLHVSDEKSEIILWYYRVHMERMTLNLLGNVWSTCVCLYTAKKDAYFRLFSHVGPQEVSVFEYNFKIHILRK